MTRKSTFVTLGILGAAAALGTACCCCINWYEDPQLRDDLARDDKAHGPDGGHAVAPRYRPHVWVPIFWGGGGYAPAPGRVSGAPGSPRGGFGATASGHGGSGAGA